jgi:hypothetical protein
MHVVGLPCVPVTGMLKHTRETFAVLAGMNPCPDTQCPGCLLQLPLHLFTELIALSPLVRFCYLPVPLTSVTVYNVT